MSRRPRRRTTHRDAGGLRERIEYAVVAGVFGALGGFVLWVLLGLGWGRRNVGHGLGGDLSEWVTGGVLLMGGLGLLLGERAGDVFGDFLASSLHGGGDEPDPQVPRGLVWALVIVVLVAAIGYAL